MTIDHRVSSLVGLARDREPPQLTTLFCIAPITIASLLKSSEA